MRDSARLKAKPDCVGCAAANRTCGLLIRNQPHSLLSYGDMQSACGESCTRTLPVLNRQSLLLDYAGIKWCPWQDSHPHWTASEAVVSALDYMGIKLAASGGFAPPTLCFKGRCSDC